MISRRVRAIQESIKLRGLKGPTPGGELNFWCPFCEVKGVPMGDPNALKGCLRVTGKATLRNPETREKEQVELSLANGVFNCWRCHTHGIGDFSWLADGGFDLPKASAPKPPEHPGPPESFEKLSGHPRHTLYREYLKGRSVLPAAVAVGAGVCFHGKYHGRVVIPHIEDGQWRGFVARSLSKTEPPIRYLQPRGMPRRQMLWGSPFVQPRDGTVWVVEGVFDALALFPHAVATYGTGVTDEQLQLLLPYERLVVCFDGEAAAEGKWLAQRLRMRGAQASWCHLPIRQDPGVLGWGVLPYLQPTG